jgi:hypothetical protein
VRRHFQGSEQQFVTVTATLPRSLAPLRHRSFALLWAGVHSNVGTWMETVGVGILVDDHAQAGWTGLAAAFVPSVPRTGRGALADRLPRRRVLATTTVQTAPLRC